MMSRRLLLLCILSGFMMTSAVSLSILLVEPLVSFSHHLWTMTMLKGLLEKGHHVHVVSIKKPVIDNDLAQNLTYDVFENAALGFENIVTEWQDLNVLNSAYVLYDWSIVVCERTMRTKAAKDLLEFIKHNEFDVIVQDVTLYQCLYGLWEVNIVQVAKGKPPIVGFIPFGPAPWIKHYFGGLHYSNMRSYVYATVTSPATMWERKLNVLYYMIDDFIRYYYYLPASQRLAEKYVGHEITPLWELEKSISIVLINTYPAFDGEIPLPPNAIEIGGMHAQVQSVIGVDARYSKKMREFLDEANNGAIVISFGTNVHWKHIRLDKIKAVVSALSRLKQRVLWKTDIDTPMPDNVMAVQWLPQNDVLNHKNVKAIWTHGGLLSMQEAIWKGVPVVGMPFVLDQKYNVNKLVNKGVGVRLDFETLSTQSVLDALQEIVYNKSYTENMKRLSSEYRDRSLPPLDLAIWSIEYAARHPNESSASPNRSQNWIERNLIDIYVIVFLILIITLSAEFFTVKLLYSYFCKNTKSRKEKQM